MNHRHFSACLLAAVAALVIHSPAVAARDATELGPPDLTSEFPAGMACSDFGLRLEVWEGRGKTKDLRDRSPKRRSTRT